MKQWFTVDSSQLKGSQESTPGCSFAYGVYPQLSTVKFRSIPREFLRSEKNFLGIRQKIFLQRRSVRHRRIQRRDAHQGPIQVAKRLFAENRRDFSGDSSRLRVFMDDQAFVGL